MHTQDREMQIGSWRRRDGKLEEEEKEEEEMLYSLTTTSLSSLRVVSLSLSNYHFIAEFIPEPFHTHNYLHWHRVYGVESKDV